MTSPQLNLRYLIENKRKNIPNIGNYGSMNSSDIKRIDMFVQGNIFHSNECCLYSGEIKNTYSTISYNSKKVSVLRLLYHNYVNNIQPNDNIEYLCENKGVCCNLSHFKLKNKVSTQTKFKKTRNIEYEINPFIEEKDLPPDDEIFQMDL